MATIRDVAEFAHVSAATVSRVLKKSGPVSPETEARVYDAIEKLGYLPPHSSKKNNENKKLSVLVLFPNSMRSMHSAMRSGIRDAAREEGILLYYAVCDNDIELEASYVNELRHGIFDGLIFMGTFLQVNDLLQLKKTCQIALCGESVDEAQVLSVAVDCEQAAYEAVSHLISLGHKKIAMITTHRRVWSSIKKEDGYRRALLDHGLPVEEEYIFYGRFTSNNSRYILNYYEAMDEPPTAYFCISDDVARSICNCLMERNYEIGAKLSVCGFDDSDSSTSAYPRLTTVNQPFYDIGRKVMELLKNNMTSVIERNEVTYMPHKLYIRESTSKKEDE